MAEFYRFPYWILIALEMTIALCIVLQTMAVTYSVRRLRTGWLSLVENWMEGSILVVLFLYAALVAQVQYSLFCDCFLPSGYELPRQVFFFFTAVLSITAAVGLELIWPFFVIAAAAVLLPITEHVLAQTYPVFFLTGILFFLMRSIHICLLRRRELYTQITYASVKEAIDKLHTGLLFCRPEGDILLCNRQMETLAYCLTGEGIQNGEKFRECLEHGDLCLGCSREELRGQTVFRLQDGSVWSISWHKLMLGRRGCMLLTADDVTERWDAVRTLAQQNEELEQLGRELRRTIENLQIICEAEEVARGKGRVHDLLGQRISLLLRALREDQQPDEKLLLDFVEKLPLALREDESPGPARRLELLVDTFRGMGVTVQVQGTLPEREDVARDFAEIAVECVTNAVRHGYATHVQFHIFQNDCWRMTVTDNGIPPSGPIREGGGISGMRRRIDRLGGTLILYTMPRFRIQISVPKEGAKI